MLFYEFIIVYDKPDQLRNQLLAYRNIMAIGKDCNMGVILLLPHNYFKLLVTDGKYCKKTEFMY